MATEQRSELIRRWIDRTLGRDAEIAMLAGDASFRRYFRVHHQNESYVLMDAPPAHEDVTPFLRVRSWFEQAGLRIARMHAEDLENGLLLMEDFGDITWSGHRAAGHDMAPLFTDALRQLHLLQASAPDFELPRFDIARMQRECDLYLDWYLPRVAGIEPTASERDAFHARLADTLTTLASLPQAPVHLDYHSRNLMLPAGALPLGQIDYQDAVIGPVTYDLASLLYDCYQDYPEAERLAWSQHFYSQLPAQAAENIGSFENWHKMLRLTALQRHLKAIGIFARLAYRDGKRQFLDEIPLTRKHLREEMAALGMQDADFPLLLIEPAAS